MNRDEYARMAAVEETMWWYRALHDRMVDGLRRLHLGAGARVLDAGCGTGGLLQRLRRDEPTLECVGLELDEDAAAIARTKSHAPVVHGSINAMPFPAGRFAAVVSADVLSHAGVDETAALAEFERCLAPGGTVLLNLPAYNWMLSSHDAHVHNIRRYTARGARALAEVAGFRVTGVGYWNSLLFPFLLLYRLTLGRRTARSDVREFPAWQNRLFYSLTVVERRLARRGFAVPFGGSVWLLAVKQ